MLEWVLASCVFELLLFFSSLTHWSSRYCYCHCLTGEKTDTQSLHDCPMFKQLGGGRTWAWVSKLIPQIAIITSLLWLSQLKTRNQYTKSMLKMAKDFVIHAINERWSIRTLTNIKVNTHSSSDNKYTYMVSMYMYAHDRYRKNIHPKFNSAYLLMWNY